MRLKSSRNTDPEAVVFCCHHWIRVPRRSAVKSNGAQLMCACAYCQAAGVEGSSSVNEHIAWCKLICFLTITNHLIEYIIHVYCIHTVSVITVIILKGRCKI